MKRIFITFGTRPEAIKLAPVIKEFEKHPEFETVVCLTGQHQEMLYQPVNFFGIKPHCDMQIMKPNQTLFDITVDSVRGYEKALKEMKPDLLIVQGDTTTAFTGALSAFYYKIPVGHVEAGLRSHNKYSPFPEEINRVLVGRLTDLHFAPTETARKNLLNEGIPDEMIFVTGNTVVDANLQAIEIIRNQGLDKKIEQFLENVAPGLIEKIKSGKKLILVTAHRRESFGKPFENLCLALKDIALTFKDKVEIVYPVHLNPNVRKPVFEILGNLDNLHLIDPVDYPTLIYLLEKSYLVLTDSGGIQEEAPSFGKPVLVMREVTERMEGVDAGIAKLVGTDRGKIFNEASRLLRDKKAYESMAKAINPYGDGRAAERIVKIVSEFFSEK